MIWSSAPLVNHFRFYSFGSPLFFLSFSPCQVLCLMEFVRVSHKMLLFLEFKIMYKDFFWFFPIYLSHVLVYSQAANAKPRNQYQFRWERGGRVRR
jgi:hypothetical protein